MTTRFKGRYVFVAGLHRTGTSLLARLLETHPQIAAITDAPVPEKEGCFLQGAIAHTAQSGIPGRYATDPAQHLIENCRFDTQATRERLEADWQPWFTPGGQWRLEKSPVNLTRMRLYQQLFPLSQFIVILRHPEAMAAALAKWTDAPASELIDYALDAYDIALADMKYLHSSYLLRYEDLVQAPEPYLESLFAWLSLAPIAARLNVRDGNADYSGAQPMTAEQAERARQLGYFPRLQIDAFDPAITQPLRSVRETAQGVVSNKD